jgi:hypothetical protein
MRTIIPFRLIEHQFGRIVNSIEAGCCHKQPSNDPGTDLHSTEMKLKQTSAGQLPAQRKGE